MHADPKIDPEFAALCPPLTPEERGLLEAGIERDGLREPLTVWKEEGLLLDGHNRFDICKTFGIGCKVKEISLKDRAAAVEWIITNQLGRRNCTEEQKKYLRGKRYHHEKKKQGGDRKSEKSKGHSDPLISTAEKVADETGVSPKTIKRDAKFAAAVDSLAETQGPELKAEILTGRSGLTKKDVVAIAEKPAEKQAEAIEAAKRNAPRSEAFKSEYDKLIERIESLVEFVNAMAAHRLGHNDKSKAVVASLKAIVPQVRAMAKSWRNE